MTKSGRFSFSHGFLIALAGAILHSGKAIFTKLAYAVQHVDASTVLTLRMLFALPFYLFFYLLFKHRSESRQPITANLWKQSIVVGLLFYISAILDFEGLKHVTASMERLILFIYPSLVLLFLALFYRKPIRRYQYLALLLTYSGILLAFFHEAMAYQFDHSFIIGSLLIFFCSCIYAFYIIKNGHLIAHLGVEKTTSITMIICCLAAILYYLFDHNISTLFNYNAQMYWLCLSMAAISTVLPTYMIAYGIKKIGAGDAAIVNTAGPVSTIIQANIILGETIGGYQVAGTLLVLFGVWMIGRNKNKI